MRILFKKYIHVVLILLFISGIGQTVFAQITITRCPNVTFRCSGTTTVECRLNTSDPCSCDDPLNITLEDGTICFHDQLIITSNIENEQIPAGQHVLLDNWQELRMSPNFLNEEGENIIETLIAEFNANKPANEPNFGEESMSSVISYNDEFPLGPADENGVIVVDFWRKSPSVLNIDLVYSTGISSGVGTYFDADPLSFQSVCQPVNCNPIPAAGEWGLVILGLSLLIGGTVVIRHRTNLTGTCQRLIERQFT